MYYLPLIFLPQCIICQKSWRFFRFWHILNLNFPFVSVVIKLLSHSNATVGWVEYALGFFCKANKQRFITVRSIWWFSNTFTKFQKLRLDSTEFIFSNFHHQRIGTLFRSESRNLLYDQSPNRPNRRHR